MSIKFDAKKGLNGILYRQSSFSYCFALELYLITKYFVTKVLHICYAY